MRKRSRLAFMAAGGAIALSSPAPALEFPSLRNTKLDSAAIWDAGSGFTKYQYRMIHSGEIQFPIGNIFIDMRSDSTREVFDGSDLPVHQMFLEKASSRSRHRLGQSGFVAFGTLNQPEEWISSLSLDGDLSWFASTEDARWGPEDPPATFLIVSPGLPGIRDVVIEADYSEITPNPDEMEISVDDIGDALREARQKVRVVGPVAPPAIFVLHEFAGEIDALRVGAREEGWIRSDAWSVSIADSLRAIESDLAAESYVAAKPRIADLIRSVEANSCTEFDCPEAIPLTAEARALLAINLRYLLGRIPNEAPVCVALSPTLSELWPANHELAEVGIDGIVDPDGDAVEISVLEITQDEPAAGPGKQACPDAVVEGNSIRLRSEREGGGDGRTYHLSIQASDPVGATCSGIATVCVPHDRSGDECPPSDPIYDSSRCD